MRKPNIIIIIIIDSELVFSFEPQRIIPTESIHHRPSIQDAKLLVATRKTQRKIHEYRICFTKLKIQLNVIRYHDANPQTNTRYMHSAFIIYLLIIILRWIYHVNGIWRNFWYTQESSVKQEKRYCARCFVIFSSCAPPQSTTSNWAASSAKSHASPSSQTQTGDTSSTTKRKWDYWDHVFAEMIFFIQVIQVHFNHCHQLSAVHKTRRRHAVPVDSFNEIDTEFGGNSPPEASKATVVIWFPWNYSPPTTPHQAHQGSLRLQPTPKDLSLEQNA